MEDWTNQDIITQWIWLAILVVILITAFIILLVLKYLINLKTNREKSIQLIRDSQNRYIENTRYLQEKDRERIAGELHDNIISQLNLVRLNLDNKAPSDLNEDLKKSIRLIRELSHNLTPPDLAEIALSELIYDYLMQITPEVEVAFWQKIINTESEIDTEIKLNLFRILQELINNIIKHANASKIEILLRVSSRYLILIVKDNGMGFKNTSPYKGIGLRNIDIRAKTIGAFYKFKVAAEKGTRVIIYRSLT